MVPVPVQCNDPCLVYSHVAALTDLVSNKRDVKNLQMIFEQFI